MNSRTYHYDQHIYGSARWNSRDGLEARGYGPYGRLLFGYGQPEREGEGAYPITYDGARHLLTIAPTRSGKSVSTCIPSLLSHPGSTVIADPKGELTAITIGFRSRVLGHNALVLDPFDTICGALGITPARFNVLDWIDPDSPDFFDKAYLLADAIVVPGKGEPFWSEEAKALITAICMKVAADPSEVSQRHLGRVRDILSIPREELQEMLEGKYSKAPDGSKKLITPGMIHSPNVFLRRAAGRVLSKPEKEFGSILSTALQNTHFLESPLIQNSLSASTFDFRDLEHGNTDIYLVLPASYLNSHNRWLRLMINIAITAVSIFKTRPNPPVYFLLEEMGALGKLSAIETAYGLMAGYGMQLHCIVQDLNQLANLYSNRWQTFIANSGVVQCFGTRDIMTAEYISKLCGVGTVESLSQHTAARRASLFSDPAFLSRADMLQSRALVTPDEVMTMHPAAQILALANSYPVRAYRTGYFIDRRFRDQRGNPLYHLHPDYQHLPQPGHYDFTSPRTDVARILNHYIKVG